MTKRFVTKSAAATKHLGVMLAQELTGGEVLLLTGNLGAGKTTFVKGLARGLGIKQVITSPTFVLMKVYPARHGRIRQLVHVDCYRLPAACLSGRQGRHGVPGVELTKIGLTDYLGAPDTVVVVEWAECMKLPRQALHVKFLPSRASDTRTITLR